MLLLLLLLLFAVSCSLLLVLFSEQRFAFTRPVEALSIRGLSR